MFLINILYYIASIFFFCHDDSYIGNIVKIILYYNQNTILSLYLTRITFNNNLDL